MSVFRDLKGCVSLIRPFPPLHSGDFIVRIMEFLEFNEGNGGISNKNLTKLKFV